MTRAIVRRSIGLVLCAVCCVLSGCVHRSLTVLTEPPGARVYINDELKGETPITYDFTWYGAYRLTLRKDGFERMDDQRMIRAPIYLWIPFDLAMELVPLTIRDARTWSYILTKSAVLPTPVPPQTITPAQEPVAIAPAASEDAATTAVPSPDASAPPASSAATSAADVPADDALHPHNTETPDGTR